MEPSKVITHGVSRRTTLADAVDANIEELQIDGYTILDSGLSRDQLENLCSLLDRAHARQQADSRAAADTDIVRCPLAHDDLFLAVATNHALMALCRRVFGENFVLLQQNGIINRPHTREYQSRWHRDLSYQHFVASRKIAINALLCLGDFTAETGGTWILPGTHQIENFPSDRYVMMHEKVAAARAGSFLVLDAMLFHRGGYNASPAGRYGLNHLIGLPFLAQQVDIPRMLQRDFSNDPFLNRYLGYRWNPAADVETWRKRRT